ncbi:MAG: HDOD domain-containing protein [Dissulfurispiraceae bacterium]|jgi:HD-like signal output (HDOD) protein|nr:HDOD domain-containing protein [Dissulfurispiraceae bacterium]
MLAHDDKDIIERIKSGYSLPSLSTVAMKLVDMASSETSSIDEMSNLIEKDPALTVRLLKTANSAFFKTQQPITTVDQSIMRIGINHLRMMALSLSLRDTFPLGKVGSMDYEKFWRASVYQALLAKSLAVQLKTCKPEEAFVAGLVLEIGFLIFHDLFVKNSNIKFEGRLYPIEDQIAWEEENFGTNHRKVGKAALTFWQFPPVIVECQDYYAASISDENIPPLARMTVVAHEFSSLICDESLQWETIFSKTEHIYKIDHDILTDILISTFEDVEQLSASLKVEMSRQKDIIALIEKAHVTLNTLSNKLPTPDGLPPSFSSLAESLGDARVRSALQAVAHEIRNPLVAVGGFARKLAASIDPASPEWQYVEVIEKEATRLQKAISIMTGNIKSAN